MNLIKRTQIDIDNFIENLWANGERGNDIVITLYDCRINGIDSIPKAESAYKTWVEKSQIKGV